MTKLEELLYSLTTVLVRYHDSQGINRCVTEIDPELLRKKTRKYAFESFTAQAPFKKLEDLIKECTNGYPGRKSFLYYLLHEVNFLKIQLDRKKPYEQLELEDYINQISQLLMDFRLLLNTTKNSTCKIKYSKLNGSEPSIDLAGLGNDKYLGNALCNSGLFLKEEVLDRFHITTSYTNSEIKEIATSLCYEHQNTLLVAELQSQKFILTAKNTEQQASIESLRTQLTTAELALAGVRTQYDELERSTAEQKIKQQDQISSTMKDVHSGAFFSLGTNGGLSPLRTSSTTSLFQRRGHLTSMFTTARIPNRGLDQTADTPSYHPNGDWSPSGQ